ncbi:SMI1/KNR4 family protein [Photobacterium galatheae]|uniref:Knr4/Smi1-like domain-containing protein n=1 Tax=Photobacterium galatheae TaxID=1654360 RepID=A0A066S0M7_9GAMM|nr:SMI1/KNR4 family protein [Photobacterium galatheae]KDM93163.1 hypothetical protein EA58_02945 [Photobacterium galatheae]MCM0148308.1 SMI1/KNR4 family protein [Photobacterium galatheae]
MSTIDFVSGTSCEQLTSEDWENIEEYLDERFEGKRLPNALNEILNKNNGGMPVQRCFETHNNKHPIKIFYDLSEDGTIILHESTNMFDMYLFYKERFNNLHLMPIAETSFGDVVVLDYEGTPKDNPRVALWFHECDEHGMNSQPLEHIADDMASFLDMLTED